MNGVSIAGSSLFVTVSSDDDPEPERGKGMGIKIKVILCFSMILSALLFLYFVPVWVLTLSDGEISLLSRPSILGYPFITRYVHSVERTPVEDEYRVVGGRIWGWEERVVSQNAGLPIVVPRNGRLVVDGEWFRFRGAGAAGKGSITGSGTKVLAGTPLSSRWSFLRSLSSSGSTLPEGLKYR